MAEENRGIDLEQLRQQRIVWKARKTLGRRIRMEREGLRPVDAILHRPDFGEKLPVIFNMHGGAWIGGDAVLMETFCEKLAREIPAVVVNVNYQKADVESFPYAMDEVVFAAKYMAAHADEYGVDPEKMAVMGHSAGAQMAAGAAMKLKEEGIRLACQALIYPCTDMRPQPGLFEMIAPMLFPEKNWEHRWASPVLASQEELSGLAPAIFVECGLDELKPQGIAYARRLIDAGVPVKVKEYAQALHGFLEVNRPDYPAEDPRRTPEQDAYRADCENYLIWELRACFAEG